MARRQVFFSLLWFSLFVIWIWLLVTVLVDIFRSRDLSGGAKGLWFLFVVFFPYLGVFVYVIVHGAQRCGRSAGTATTRCRGSRWSCPTVRSDALAALMCSVTVGEIGADEYLDPAEQISWLTHRRPAARRAAWGRAGARARPGGEGMSKKHTRHQKTHRPATGAAASIPRCRRRS